MDFEVILKIDCITDCDVDNSKPMNGSDETFEAIVYPLVASKQSQT